MKENFRLEKWDNLSMTPVQEILRSRLDILMKEISELNRKEHTIQEVRLIFQIV